jgi:hypothetical protein
VSCPQATRVLYNRLATIEGNLAAGLKIAQYRALIADAEVAYNLNPVSRMSYPCIVHVGVPEENALNDYVHALNSWAQCLSKSLYSNCLQSGSVADQFEQGQWNKATAQLQKASNALG